MCRHCQECGSLHDFSFDYVVSRNPHLVDDRAAGTQPCFGHAGAYCTKTFFVQQSEMALAGSWRAWRACSAAILWLALWTWTIAWLHGTGSRWCSAVMNCWVKHGILKYAVCPCQGYGEQQKCNDLCWQDLTGDIVHVLCRSWQLRCAWQRRRRRTRPVSFCSRS